MCGTLAQFPILALTLQRGELLPSSLRLDYDYDYDYEHEHEFVIRQPRRRLVKRVLASDLARLCPSLSQRTKAVELLDLDRIRSVYLLLEHGTGQTDYAAYSHQLKSFGNRDDK